MIYFIACREANAVKIGRTSKKHYATADASAFQRLASMQSACPFELQMLATCGGGEAEERALHARFAHLRTRGEWFRLTEEITGHIADFHRPVRLSRGWNKKRRSADAKAA